MKLSWGYLFRFENTKYHIYIWRYIVWIIFASESSMPHQPIYVLYNTLIYVEPTLIYCNALLAAAFIAALPHSISSYAYLSMYKF